MLAIDGVSKAYDPFRLGPVSLSVRDEVLAVLGPSGCGKTTLLSIVAGIVAPDAGSIALDGRTLDGLPPEDRGTALVFQDGALFPHMTARENVAYAAASPGRVDGLAERLGIGDVLDQPATTLSGGQRQRVALARSLAAEPDALLLDEPLANLDAPEKRRLREELRDLLAGLDAPAVYVTHDQREATVVGDRLAVMNDGRVLQVGTPDEVFERPATPFVASFTGGANVFRATVVGADGDPAIRWGDARLRVPDYGYADGARTQFCVRPEYVELADGDGDDGDGDNAIDCRIARRTYEGDAYRVGLVPEGVDAELEWLVRPARYDEAGLAGRETVRVRLPAGAIHLMDDA